MNQGPDRSLCSEETFDCLTDVGCFTVGGLASYFTGGTLSDAVQNGAALTGVKDACVDMARKSGSHLGADALIVAAGSYAGSSISDKVQAGAKALGVVKTCYHMYQMSASSSQRTDLQPGQSVELAGGQTLTRRRPT